MGIFCRLSNWVVSFGSIVLLLSLSIVFSRCGLRGLDAANCVITGVARDVNCAVEGVAPVHYYLYIPDFNNKVYVYDLATPSQPIQISGSPFSLNGCTYTGGIAADHRAKFMLIGCQGKIARLTISHGGSLGDESNFTDAGNWLSVAFSHSDNLFFAGKNTQLKSYAMTDQGTISGLFTVNPGSRTDKILLHPNLKVIYLNQGSGWDEIQSWDYDDAGHFGVTYSSNYITANGTRDIALSADGKNIYQVTYVAAASTIWGANVSETDGTMTAMPNSPFFSGAFIRSKGLAMVAGFSGIMINTEYSAAFFNVFFPDSEGDLGGAYTTYDISDNGGVRIASHPTLPYVYIISDSGNFIPIKVTDSDGSVTYDSMATISIPSSSTPDQGIVVGVP